MRLGYFNCDVMLNQKKLMFLSVKEEFIDFEIFDEGPLRVIWEFQSEITAGKIKEWLLSRLPEDNRNNLLHECEAAGIKPIGADIFRISQGKQLYDDYWFRFSDNKALENNR